MLGKANFLLGLFFLLCCRHMCVSCLRVVWKSNTDCTRNPPAHGQPVVGNEKLTPHYAIRQKSAGSTLTPSIAQTFKHVLFFDSFGWWWVGGPFGLAHDAYSQHAAITLVDLLVHSFIVAVWNEIETRMDSESR